MDCWNTYIGSNEEPIVPWWKTELVTLWDFSVGVFLPSLGGFECNALILKYHFCALLCSTTLLSVMLLICQMQQPDYWVDNVDVMTRSCYTIMLSLLFGTGLCLVYLRPFRIDNRHTTLCGFDTWSNNSDSSASGPFIRDTCDAWLYRVVL